MTDPWDEERIGPLMWDGTWPYPLKMAQRAVYPISAPDRAELNELYVSSSPHRTALPEEIWPQLDAAVSIYRAIHEEKQFNKPYAKTKRDLEIMQRRLIANADDIAHFYSRDASGKYFFIERFGWVDLELKLRNAYDTVGKYIKEMEEYQRKPGPDWRHEEAFVLVLENILLRNGCSLIREVPRTRKKERLVPVLVKFLQLARMQTDTKIEAKRNEIRADNLIEEVALKIHRAFFDLSDEERSRQITLYSASNSKYRDDNTSN